MGRAIKALFSPRVSRFAQFPVSPKARKVNIRFPFTMSVCARRCVCRPSVSPLEYTTHNTLSYATVPLCPKLLTCCFRHCFEVTALGSIVQKQKCFATDRLQTYWCRNTYGKFTIASLSAPQTQCRQHHPHFHRFPLPLHREDYGKLHLPDLFCRLQ